MSISEKRIAEVCERLVVVEPDAGIFSHTLMTKTAGLIRVARGAYLHPDPDWKKWELVEMVTLARIVWVHQRNPEAVMVLESAAILHGLPLMERVPNVHLANLRGNFRRTVFPALDEHEGVFGRMWLFIIHGVVGV